jgi:drug/metabolite transporter (DMT)-like permease
LGVFLGITGAICWGMADFAARFSSRRVGAFRTLFFMQFFGFLALSVFVKLTGGFSGVGPGWRPWELSVFAGVINVFASLSLYHSFEIGVMTIVAPVSSCYPALTAVLAFASGERIGPLRGAGLAITLAGVVFAAMSFSPLSSAGAGTDAGVVAANSPAEKAGRGQIQLSKGVGWAILAAMGFGFLFWFLGFHVVPAVGSGVSVWVMRLTAIVALLFVSFPARQTVRMPHGGVWWLLAAVGFMDTAAFVVNNSALRIGPVSVVSVLASLYGAVTVLLSWIFLREKLARSQWLGVLLIFVGIVFVSL